MAILCPTRSEPAGARRVPKRNRARCHNLTIGRPPGFSDKINLDRLTRYTTSFEVPRLIKYARARWNLWRLGNNTEKSPNDQ